MLRNKEKVVFFFKQITFQCTLVHIYPQTFFICFCFFRKEHASSTKCKTGNVAKFLRFLKFYEIKKKKRLIEKRCMNFWWEMFLVLTWYAVCPNRITGSRGIFFLFFESFRIQNGDKYTSKTHYDRAFVGFNFSITSNQIASCISSDVAVVTIVGIIVHSHIFFPYEFLQISVLGWEKTEKNWSFKFSQSRLYIP